MSSRITLLLTQSIWVRVCTCRGIRNSTRRDESKCHDSLFLLITTNKHYDGMYRLMTAQYKSIPELSPFTQEKKSEDWPHESRAEFERQVFGARALADVEFRRPQLELELDNSTGRLCVLDIQWHANKSPNRGRKHPRPYIFVLNLPLAFVARMTTSMPQPTIMIQPMKAIIGMNALNISSGNARSPASKSRPPTGPPTNDANPTAVNAMPILRPSCEALRSAL